MGRKACFPKEGMNRGAWSVIEDQILIDYIKTHGEGKWADIPKKSGLKRCGKSCRLRWLNYLRPDIKRGNITEQEEDLIIRLHKLLGNRWSLIAGRLPGRTDNEIKNYWNSTLSKKLVVRGDDDDQQQQQEQAAKQYLAKGKEQSLVPLQSYYYCYSSNNAIRSEAYRVETPKSTSNYYCYNNINNGITISEEEEEEEEAHDSVAVAVDTNTIMSPDDVASMEFDIGELFASDSDQFWNDVYSSSSSS